MDYEKAYKAVLQTATQWIKDGCTDKEKICLECVFPELRESDDERIRKWLADYFGSIKETVWIHRDITCGQILAWLEKQKYDRMKLIYDARESFESALEKAWNDYHNGYENVDKLEDDYVECAHAKGFREGYLFGIEKQKEQKPAWSEEDERRIDAICELLENTSAIHPNYSHRKLIIWLKSLRPSWKPSDQDELMKLKYAGTSTKLD